VTNCGALSARFAASERTALAASTRQAIALMRWAHKFGPAEHVQRAEHFLLERMRLMLTVRAPKTWSCALTPHQAEIASQHSGVLQAEELRWHQSTDYDILFECWAVADRLNLHALAAECEWGLT